MSMLRRTLTALTLLAALAGTLTVLGGAAYAHVPPPDPGSVVPPTPAITTISHGSPLWVFAVVAAVSAAVTLTAVLTAGKLRRSAQLSTAQV